MYKSPPWKVILLIEGSGSGAVSLTNGSGRSKNGFTTLVFRTSVLYLGKVFFLNTLNLEKSEPI
jgi:hypothetical protein